MSELEAKEAVFLVPSISSERGARPRSRQRKEDFYGVGAVAGTNGEEEGWSDGDGAGTANMRSTREWEEETDPDLRS